MKRVIQVLRDNKLPCYPNERFSLEVEMFPDGMVPEPRLPSVQARFENPIPEEAHHFVDLPDNGSAFRYFLDGSQRSYRVIDADFNGRYLPICAGQIGVAVMERQKGLTRPVREYCTTRNILAVPDRMDDCVRAELEQEINNELPKDQAFSVVCYALKADGDEDPGDLGRAKIIHGMQLLELDTIRRMIEESRLSVDMLAKDGSLQYRDDKIKDLGFGRHDESLQLANVVGISKSFRPNYTLAGGGRRIDLGNLVSGLDFAERSIVVTPDKSSDVRIGWWYLRIRSKDRMTTPLQGTVKLEVFAITPEERDSGIHLERADTISSYVLAERNVTPFDRDSRWANHIYPIYLAETYLKSSFLSPTAFKSIVY